MSDPVLLVMIASTGTLALALSAAAALKGWQGWLEIKRLEIDDGSRRRPPKARPEIADLRERVRRLEGIANGARS